MSVHSKSWSPRFSFAGLRINEALALAEAELDTRRGSLLVRRGGCLRSLGRSVRLRNGGSVMLIRHGGAAPRIATLLGCTVKAAAYVAAGATVLHGAAVGSGAVVAVGALAHGGTRLPNEFFVPPGTIAIGDPPRIYAPSQHAELAQAVKEVGFAARAFGVATAWEDRVTRYREVAEVRSREFAAHADDEVIAGEPPIG